MENLKGKRILIGKEPQNGRLLIAVVGIPSPIAIGSPNSVPNSVSRCKVQEGIAHAELKIEQSGELILRNMKPQNITYINDSEIDSKRVNPSSVAELGINHYPVPIQAILNAAQKIVDSLKQHNESAYYQRNNSNEQVQKPNQPPKRFNIRHLEDVWNEYHDGNIRLQKRSKRHGAYGRIPLIFTMGSGAATAISNICGLAFAIQLVCGSLTLIGFALLLFFFRLYNKDNSIEERDILNDQFVERYSCPNPECKKFLGNMSYKLMKRQYSMRCPYCKCEFFE